MSDIQAFIEKKLAADPGTVRLIELLSEAASGVSIDAFIHAVILVAWQHRLACQEDAETAVLMEMNATTPEEVLRAHRYQLRAIIRRIDASMAPDDDAGDVHHGDADGPSHDESPAIGSRDTAAEGVVDGKPKRWWAWLKRT